jgi:hypothetical protein
MHLDSKDSSEFAVKGTASLQPLHAAQKPCLEEGVHAPCLALTLVTN